MGCYIGADWASKGWVAAELDETGDLTVGFFPTIWNLWHDRGAEADQILVDIPIGLPDEGRRTCDRRAKERLSDRGSSVFWTPIRDAVYENNVEDARQVQTETMDYSISNQAWAIVPRIREVDTFLQENRDDAEGVVRESHPEVCFQALNGDDGLGPKSDEDGIANRKDVLCDQLDIDDQECHDVVASLTEPDYARLSGEDDVLDAMVLAVTARKVADGECSTLPENPSKDDRCLPMEIVYPET